VYGWERAGKLSDLRKQTIEQLYDGEIAWTSHQLGRFVDGLARLGGNTLLVFHSDHGEEFWEHGGFEHNHTLYEEVVRTALWVRPPPRQPGGSQRLAVPATLADIAPTLYDYAGLSGAPPSDGVSLRPFIEGAASAAPPDRPLPIGYLRYDRERWGVVYRDHKYTLVTETGAEQLFDLVADPHERMNLADPSVCAGMVGCGQDLGAWRAATATAHGVDLGAGWRIHLALTLQDPVVLELPEPALSAGVIDPESTSSHPVNQEWGEVPPKFPGDVAAVALSDDGRTVTITPGRDPNGTLYIRYARDVPTSGAVLHRAGEALAMQPTSATRQVWHAQKERITLEAGTVVVPPPDEAALMVLRANAGQASADEITLLQSLGYIGGDEEEHAPR
jgi:hypothetical protein